MEFASKIWILSLAFLFYVHNTKATVAFESCGAATIGDVTNVDISGCDGQSPCRLIRGGNASMAISFHTSRPVSQVQSVVHGVLHGLPIPFNFPFPDACSYGGLTCPLTPNAPLLYSATLPILKVYPRVSVKIQWQLKDGDGNDIFCIRIPAILH